VPLNLYREHTSACTQKRRVRLHNRKTDESPRYGWKKCDCPIYASGTLGDGFRRKKTNHTTWPEAEAQALGWEQAGAWAAPPVTVPPATETARTDSPAGISIADALDAFIEKSKKHRIKPPTIRKYKTFTKQFGAYLCDTKGYVVASQLKMVDGELFYATWKDGPRAAGKKLERFRKLVRFWVKRQWITSDLGVFDIEPPIGANEPGDRLPFTDEEIETIYTACDEIGEITWRNGPLSGSWNGQDAKDFIILSVFTGLRISDVATFDVKKRLQGNDIFLRAKKNDKRLFTWVPNLVRDRLLDRQKRVGSRIFQTGLSDRLETVTDTWRKKLNRVFEIAQKEQKFEQKPTPHRFRYTFVRILLQRGVPVPDVAELAGDTEEIINKHYAKWVPERQERLTNILKAAFADRPKLVVSKK
jgi:integrase